MIAIVGAATVGSLFAAGFVLMIQPLPAEHPAGTSPLKAGAEPPAPPIARTIAKAPPPVIERAARAPAMLSRMAAPSPEKPLSSAFQFAMAQGDARFAEGNASGARFFYEQAVDAGDPTGALRMGETFDPAFLAFGRLRLVEGDPEAARFWYRRALGLGAAEAEQRLDYLKTEALDDRPTTDSPSKFRRRAAQRRYRHARPPIVTFYEMPEQHPKSDGP